MYKYTPLTYSLTPHGPPAFANGVVGNGKAELDLANKVLAKVGESRFSVVSFGIRLHDAISTDDEKDKVLLAFLYYVNSLAGEDTERGAIAAKIVNTMRYHGYVTEVVSDPMA